MDIYLGMNEEHIKHTLTMAELALQTYNWSDARQLYEQILIAIPKYPEAEQKLRQLDQLEALDQTLQEMILDGDNLIRLGQFEQAFRQYTHIFNYAGQKLMLKYHPTLQQKRKYTRELGLYQVRLDETLAEVQALRRQDDLEGVQERLKRFKESPQFRDLGQIQANFLISPTESKADSVLVQAYQTMTNRLDQARGRIEQELDLETIYEQANQAFHDQDFAEAIHLYSLIPSHSTHYDEAQLHLKRAKSFLHNIQTILESINSLFQNNRFDSALAELETLRHQYPHSQVWQQLWLKVGLAQGERALDLGRQANVEHDFKAAQSYFLAAKAAFQQILDLDLKTTQAIHETVSSLHLEAIDGYEISLAEMYTQIEYRNQQYQESVKHLKRASNRLKQAQAAGRDYPTLAAVLQVLWQQQIDITFNRVQDQMPTLLSQGQAAYQQQDIDTVDLILVKMKEIMTQTDYIIQQTQNAIPDFIKLLWSQANLLQQKATIRRDIKQQDSTLQALPEHHPQNFEAILHQLAEIILEKISPAGVETYIPYQESAQRYRLNSMINKALYQARQAEFVMAKQTLVEAIELGLDAAQLAQTESQINDLQQDWERQMLQQLQDLIQNEYYEQAYQHCQSILQNPTRPSFRLQVEQQQSEVVNQWSQYVLSIYQKILGLQTKPSQELNISEDNPLTLAAYVDISQTLEQVAQLRPTPRHDLRYQLRFLQQKVQAKRLELRLDFLEQYIKQGNESSMTHFTKLQNAVHTIQEEAGQFNLSATLSRATNMEAAILKKQPFAQDQQTLSGEIQAEDSGRALPEKGRISAEDFISEIDYPVDKAMQVAFQSCHNYMMDHDFHKADMVLQARMTALPSASSWQAVCRQYRVMIALLKQAEVDQNRGNWRAALANYQEALSVIPDLTLAIDLQPIIASDIAYCQQKRLDSAASSKESPSQAQVEDHLSSDETQPVFPNQVQQVAR